MNTPLFFFPSLSAMDSPGAARRRRALRGLLGLALLFDMLGLTACGAPGASAPSESRVDRHARVEGGARPVAPLPPAGAVGLRTPGAAPQDDGLRRTWFVVLPEPGAVPWLRDRGVDLAEGGHAALGGAGASRGRLDVRDQLQRLARAQRRLSPRIQAAGGIVIGRLTRLANALVVVAPTAVADALRRLPGVTRVEPVPRYHRQSGVSVPLLGAPQLWTPPSDLRGRGVRVGVVDSGIDYTHAAFGGTGVVADYESNDPTVIEAGSFPTARVVGGWDFAGDAYDSGDGAADVPQPDPDPLDCPRPDSSGHGTHVASILGSGGVRADGTAYPGPYDDTLDFAEFEVAPGVAPAAELYALKVFGCGGSTSLVSLALEWAADPNEDGQLADRLDVVNLSLGSKFGLGSTSQEVVENLIALGTVVVAASGNTGSDVKRVRPFYLSDAPGVVPAVISVANTYKEATRFRQLEILGTSGGGEPLGPFPLAEGRDNPTLESTGTVSGPLVRPARREGCDPFQNAADFPGAVALVDRGGCTFDTKFTHAEAARAVAVVVVDYSDADLPWSMTSISAALPGGLVRTADGARLHAALDAGAPLEAVLDASAWYPRAAGPDYVRGNSCRGPSVWDGLLKPDLAAPGTHILAAASGTGREPVSKSGTSMAAPHVAGLAALLLEAAAQRSPPGRPSPLEVKARLMSTAVAPRDLEGRPFPVSLAGAGRAQAEAALHAAAYLTVLKDDGGGGQPSGRVSVGFGEHVVDAPLEVTRTVRLTHRGDGSGGGGSLTYDTAATAPCAQCGPGVTVQVTPSEVTVGPGEHADLSVRLVVNPAALPPPAPDAVTPSVGFRDVGRHFITELDGHLELTASSPGEAVTLRLPYHALVRAANRRQAAAPRGCLVTTGPRPIRVPLQGPRTLDASAVTSAFVSLPGAEADPLLALGVSHNLKAADADPDLRRTLYFGVATRLPWRLPARYTRSAVGLHLDLDGDRETDYRVAMDSESGEEGDDDDEGNADIFSVRIYADGDDPAETYTPARVNAVDPRRLDTYVHQNSVWVLPVPLAELGLLGVPSSLGVRGYARQPDEEIVYGEFVYFDPTALPLDTTSEGVRAGRFGPTPLHDGDVVRVTQITDPPSGAPAPTLLMLHHTNVADARLETVSLAEADAAYEQGDVGVTVNTTGEATAALLSGQPRTLEFRVENHGPGAVGEVTLQLSARPVVAELTRWSALAEVGGGACGESTGPSEAPTLRCTLGDLAEGDAVIVRVTVTAELPPLMPVTGRLQLTGRVDTALGCPAPTANDEAAAELGVIRPPTPTQPQPEPGCGCGTAPGGAGAPFGPAVLLIIGGGVLAARRRRAERA
jgi:MYXO-CTERM domain-containing protein